MLGEERNITFMMRHQKLSKREFSLLEAFKTNEMALVRLVDIAPLPEKTCPELNSNDAKDEEHKEAEEEYIAQHGEGVQQQHHQDPHAWNPVDGPERPEHSDRSDGGEVELLHVEAVLEGAFDQTRYNDEAVQLVPGLLKVAASAHHTHGNHLDDHLAEEVEVDHVINHLQYLTFPVAES